ncbi:hypothetical protein ACH5RR_005474 [Cinchona calisaya]|uniref:Uncharacterized protein n=1 Tax=Cinchona calisaya TaxID=153742 RepID=A0ABD3ALC0_9GENT
MTKEPLNGFTVGAVAEFLSQLEHPGGTDSRHPDTASPAIHLGVAVLVCCSRPSRLGRWLIVGGATACIDGGGGGCGDRRGYGVGGYDKGGGWGVILGMGVETRVDHL